MKRTMLTLSTILTFVILLIVGVQFTGLSSANFFPDPGPDLQRIYIRSNGNVEPATAPLERTYNQYKLTSNIILSTIEIQRDNIVLDGAGYKIQGNASWMGNAPRADDSGNNGIVIAGRNNITLSGINIEKYTTGVRISSSSHINIIGSVFTNETASIATSMGIVIEDSSLVLIENNNFDNNRGSAIFCNGTSNTIRENTIIVAASDVDGSIHVEGSSNMVSDNKVESWFPIVLDKADSNMISRNVVSGPVNQNYGGSEGIALHVNCLNNVIVGNNITGFRGQAIRTIFSCSNNTFYGNYMANNGFAVVLQEGGVNNMFYGNTFTADSCNVSVIDAESNFWDNGTIGNYWGDYNGVDSNGDGIGDVAYTLNGFKWDNDVGEFVSSPAGQDNYPLMAPYDTENDEVVLPHQEPFSMLLIVGAFITAIAVVGAGLLVYFKKLLPCSSDFRKTLSQETFMNTPLSVE